MNYFLNLLIVYLGNSYISYMFFVNICDVMSHTVMPFEHFETVEALKFCFDTLLGQMGRQRFLGFVGSVASRTLVLIKTLG